ncbi:hypothetical protein DID88_003874 [Monilinia fructigena]|uniref:Uncharacterized protein n=1 Tax=Monilinia fructigena TaxID=38457 RepID=A0A395IUC8_9HELO|nr:hypothetical protein DID88_003874 [Monilinia fructigena]
MSLAEIVRRHLDVSEHITAATTPSSVGSPPVADPNQIKPATVTGITRPPTAQEIAEASTEEKVQMIQRLIADNSKLDNAVRESRMEQAHYKLQNTLLTLESEEAIKHLEAENELTRRELPATPQQYRRTPHQTPVASRSIRESHEHGQEPGFAALLAAAHHENSSAPTTPLISQRHGPHTPIKTQSWRPITISSLPTTPPSARPGTANSTLLPSAQFIPHSATRPAYTNSISNIPPRRRRESRDSTISAEDAEEFNRARHQEHRRGEGQEIQESQAAQSANEMLRADPRESFEVAASRTNTRILLQQRVNFFSQRYGEL